MFLRVRLLCGEKSREKSLGETRFNCGARGRLREKCRRIAWRLRTVRCCAEGSKRAGSRSRARLRRSRRQRRRHEERDEPWYFPAAPFRLAFAHSRRAGFRRGPHSRAGIARTNARLERIEGILVESGRSRTGNAA